MSNGMGLFVGFWFFLSSSAGLVCGMQIQQDFEMGRNHNTQELCEYKHQTKCVNAWIKESMQNPKSKGVDNE